MGSEAIKHSFFFIFIFAFFVLPLYSQESDVITSIEIIGLRRTKLHIVEYPLEKFLGQQSSAFDQNEVFAAIMNMGVLDPVSAELVETEDGLTLQVTVAEKWSLIPFPLVSVGSGQTNFGLFLLETNAFGLRDTAVIGGMYGSEGWTAIAMYNHTPGRQGVPGWNAMFMYRRQESDNVDRYENVHSRYFSDQLRFSLGLNYRFTEIITGSFGISFNSISLLDNNESINPPKDGAVLVGFHPGISFRQSSWDGFFLSSKNLSLGYNYNLAVSGSSFHQAELRGAFEQSIIPGFRFVAKSAGVWTSSSDILFEEGPQRAQVSILPGDYSAMHYAGLSVGLEKSIYKFRWGILSVQAAWQSVFSYREITDVEFDHGPAAGIRFYLSRIALPAVGADIAYNMVSELFQWNFSIGMSF